MSASLRRFGACLAVVIAFSLLYVQLSDDPCPFHNRPTAHAGSFSLACGGQTCICFLHTYCAPNPANVPERPLAAEISGDLPAETAVRPFFLSVYHPPRAFLQA